MDVESRDNFSAILLQMWLIEYEYKVFDILSTCDIAVFHCIR